jgi:hypothetical protein
VEVVPRPVRALLSQFPTKTAALSPALAIFADPLQLSACDAAVESARQRHKPHSMPAIADG